MCLAAGADHLLTAWSRTRHDILHGMYADSQSDGPADEKVLVSRVPSTTQPLDSETGVATMGMAFHPPSPSRRSRSEQHYDVQRMYNQPPAPSLSSGGKPPFLTHRPPTNKGAIRRLAPFVLYAEGNSSAGTAAIGPTAQAMHGWARRPLPSEIPAWAALCLSFVGSSAAEAIARVSRRREPPETRVDAPGPRAQRMEGGGG